MDFFSRLSSLKVYSKGADRAPHKPLYLLYLLAGVDRGENRLKLFSDIQETLSQAIRRFGKKSKSVHPEYPFWRIQNDGLGEVIPKNWEETELRRGNSDPKISALIGRSASGGLSLEDHEYLASAPERIRFACHQILDEHFPVSLHEEIMYFFGFSFGSGQAKVMGKELGLLRDKALNAYRHRCAISEFCGPRQLGYAGLDFTEIQWLNHGGAVQLPNFLVMTAFHRKLFHLGAFTLDEDYRILVSEVLEEEHPLLGIEQGKKVGLPSESGDLPSQSCLEWHRTKVFKG